MQRRVGKVYNPDQLFVALAWLYWGGRERGLVIRIIGVAHTYMEKMKTTEPLNDSMKHNIYYSIDAM